MLRVGPQSSNRNRLNEFAFRTLWAAIVFGFVFVLPIPTLHLVAQPPERSIPPSDRPLIPDRVPSILESGSVKPDAIHLRGSNGEAIYVPLQAYEEFRSFFAKNYWGRFRRCRTTT